MAQHRKRWKMRGILNQQIIEHERRQALRHYINRWSIAWHVSIRGAGKE